MYLCGGIRMTTLGQGFAIAGAFPEGLTVSWYHDGYRFEIDGKQDIPESMGVLTIDDGTGASFAIGLADVQCNSSVLRFVTEAFDIVLPLDKGAEE